MHESAITALVYMITKSMDQVSANISILKFLKIATGGLIQYADAEAEHVADLSICAKSRSVFRVEVALSQTLDKARQKVGRMLKDERLLGVLVVNIEEAPKWSKPKRKAMAEDWVPENVDEHDWRASTEPRDRVFSAIRHNGVTLMNNVEVQVLLFERGNPNPETVRFILLTSISSAYIFYSNKFIIPVEGQITFTVLDTRLNDIWRSIIQQAIGQHPLLNHDIQAYGLSIDWDSFRSLLDEGMFETAHRRYLRWAKAWR